MKVFIEIPAWSRYKYEFNKITNQLELDRPLNQSIPANYGFFPETFEDDSDPLDVFVLSDSPLLPGSLVTVEIQSIIFCKDQGLQDNKIIATLKDERPYKVNSILIQEYLRTYKENFIIERLGTKEEALDAIQKSRENVQKS